MEKKVSKKVVKKTTKKVDVKPKKLNSSELSHIELSGSKSQTRAMELRFAKMELAKHEVEKELIAAKHNIKSNEISAIKKKISELEKINIGRVKEQKEFIEEIKKRFNLKDGWGYNPETGEIEE